MTDLFKNDKDFKEAVGEFIIAFSELEYGITCLSIMTEFELTKKDTYFIEHLAYSFEKRVKLLTAFIDNHLSKLKPIWDELKQEIGTINRERRFLAHGFFSYSLPNEHVYTHIRENGKIVEKKLTVAEIKALTQRLHKLNTGTNGINGEFHILFTKTRVNHWNNIVNDSHKITYTVNSEVITDWKGK